LRKGAWPDVWTLVGLIALGILLSRLQTSARQAGDSDPISAAAKLLVTPAATAMSASANGISNWAGAVLHGRSLELENQRLRALAVSVEDYTHDVDRVQAEVDELRRLDGWQRSPGRAKIPADVIGYFAQENRLTLDVGATRGILPGMAVATYEGLVGRVETVDRSTAQVLLITSPAAEARISAIVDRQVPNPPAAGLLKGEGPMSLVLELADPTATVEAGDLVTTSGFSDRIPRGIVIGKVIRVDSDPVFGKLTAVVFPRVALGQIREVLVIK